MLLCMYICTYILYIRKTPRFVWEKSIFYCSSLNLVLRLSEILSEHTKRIQKKIHKQTNKYKPQPQSIKQNGLQLMLTKIIINQQQISNRCNVGEWLTTQNGLQILWKFLFLHFVFTNSNKLNLLLTNTKWPTQASPAVHKSIAKQRKKYVPPRPSVSSRQPLFRPTTSAKRTLTPTYLHIPFRHSRGYFSVFVVATGSRVGGANLLKNCVEQLVTASITSTDLHNLLVVFFFF